MGAHRRADTIEQIDPKTNAVMAIIFAFGRTGETSGWHYRMTTHEGAIWVLAAASPWEDRFHDQAPRWKRSAGA